MNATLVLSEMSPNLGHEANTLNITKILFNELRSSNKTTRSNSMQSRFYPDSHFTCMFVGMASWWKIWHHMNMLLVFQFYYKVWGLKVT